MNPALRLFYLLAPLLLLGAGAVLHFATPMARPSWTLWFFLSVFAYIAYAKRFWNFYKEAEPREEEDKGPGGSDGDRDPVGSVKGAEEGHEGGVEFEDPEIEAGTLKDPELSKKPPLEKTPPDPQGLTEGGGPREGPGERPPEDRDPEIPEGQSQAQNLAQTQVQTPAQNPARDQDQDQAPDQAPDENPVISEAQAQAPEADTLGKPAPSAAELAGSVQEGNASSVEDGSKGEGDPSIGGELPGEAGERDMERGKEKEKEREKERDREREKEKERVEEKAGDSPPLDKASFSYLFGSEDPAFSPGCLSLVVIFTSVFLGILYYFVTVNTNLRVKFLFTDLVRMGMWVSLGMTVYLALELRRMDKTFSGALLSLGFVVVGLIVLIFGRDYYAAKVFVLTVVTLICLLVGSGRLKLTLIFGFVAYLVIGILVVSKRIVSLFPFYSWIFAGEPELTASYGVILQRSVFKLAGFWGQGGAYIDSVGLVRPENMTLNALPYFSLLTGYLGVGIYFILLILVMWGLLINSFKIPSFRDRAVALGAWCFLAVNQYLSVFVIFSPRALMIWDSPFGLPFIGSFQTGFQLLLLAVLVFRNQKPA